MHHAQYLRRRQAGEYLKGKYGFGSEKTLAKLACLGGGPDFRKAARLWFFTSPRNSTNGRSPRSRPAAFDLRRGVRLRMGAPHAARVAHPRNAEGDPQKFAMLRGSQVSDIANSLTNKTALRSIPACSGSA